MLLQLSMDSIARIAEGGLAIATGTELRENVVPPYYCQLQVYCNGNSDIN